MSADLTLLVNAVSSNQIAKLAELLKAHYPALCARATASSCLSLEYVLDERYLVHVDFVSHPSYGISTPFVRIFNGSGSFNSPRPLSFCEARDVLCSSSASSSATSSPPHSTSEFVEELHPELLCPSLTLRGPRT